jgi:type I restriction enzyme M protein
LTAEHFAQFEKCFGDDPNGRAKRNPKQSKDDRWRCFSIDEVKERNYKIDGLKWLKDESLDDADELPPPDELATDAVAELESAVEDLQAIIAALENGNGK